MGNIDWLPISELPEEFKDGRDVLLWRGAAKRSVVAHWRGDIGAWTSIHGGWTVLATHFAEISPPGEPRGRSF